MRPSAPTRTDQELTFSEYTCNDTKHVAHSTDQRVHRFPLHSKHTIPRSLTLLAHPHLGDRVHGQPSAESLCVLAPISRYFVILLGRKPNSQAGYFTGVGQTTRNPARFLSRGVSKGPSYLHVKAESPAGSAWHLALRWTEEDRRERRRKEEAASSKSHPLQTPSQSLGYKPTRCLTLCGRLHNRVVLRFSCQPRRTRITHRVGYFCARFGPYFSQHHSSTCIIIFAIELLQLFRSSICWSEPDRRAKTRT